MITFFKGHSSCHTDYRTSIQKGQRFSNCTMMSGGRSHFGSSSSQSSIYCLENPCAWWAFVFNSVFKNSESTLVWVECCSFEDSLLPQMFVVCVAVCGNHCPLWLLRAKRILLVPSPPTPFPLTPRDTSRALSNVTAVSPQFILFNLIWRMVSFPHLLVFI